MLGYLKSKWDYAARHPLWSTLIASAILYAAGRVVGLLPGPAAAWRWLTEEVSLPTWVPLGVGLLLLAVCAVALIADRQNRRLAMQLDHARQPSTPLSQGKQETAAARDPLLDYKTDVFDGIRWRWRYAYDRLDMVENLHAFCPNCDIEIVPVQLGATTLFACNDCQLDLGRIDHVNNNLYNKMRAVVERRLRAKGWKP